MEAGVATHPAAEVAIPAEVAATPEEVVDTPAEAVVIQVVEEEEDTAVVADVDQATSVAAAADASRTANEVLHWQAKSHSQRRATPSSSNKVCFKISSVFTTAFTRTAMTIPYACLATKASPACMVSLWNFVAVNVKFDLKKT